MYCNSVCAGRKGQKEELAVLHAEAVCVLCLSLLRRLTTYPKGIITKMKNKVNFERVWWIFYPNTNNVFTQKSFFSDYIQQNTIRSYLDAVFQEIAEMGFKWIEAHDGNTETSRMLQTIKIIPSQWLMACSQELRKEVAQDAGSFKQMFLSLC